MSAAPDAARLGRGDSGVSFSDLLYVAVATARTALEPLPTHPAHAATVKFFNRNSTLRLDTRNSPYFFLCF